jgi:hypothetical protein
MILSPRRRTPRATRTLALAAALTLAAVAGLGGAAIAGKTTPGPTMSPNITHLKNLPQSGNVGTNGTQTDIAFQGNHAFVGNYNGFGIYDISDPANTTLVSQVYCPGSQNDISVHGNILVLSTDSSRSNNTCSSVGQSASIKSSWEGLKIFDISNLASPQYVAAVETSCGSHTHTLLPSGTDLYVYSSAFFPDASFPDCQPPHDLVDVVRIPIASPASAALVASPNLFPDGGAANTSGCHDITVFPSKNLAAGACMGDGILFDVSNPVAPVVLARKQDPNFAFWHSATFNQDGTKVVFTDELGGGVGAECTRKVGPTRGADAIFDITGTTLTFRSYFKIPRMQSTKENCVAHNGSLIPAAGRDIMVQAWYQGGLSVFDFTDSANPQEIAYFDRPALVPTSTAGFWSAYYYNGHIYGSEIARGFDVLRISDPRTDSASSVVLERLNVQTQPVYR